ncbi:hypothetical protein DUI87_30499 [Hirundo rustica rustica]|uniref:Uncharacterized protein n=1 Tax=Hirundo rustica rustica TaxID=333673 RepID=A0A3M0J1Y4_HIRRU|nr:hypothetical protein DUI87_30499 [Hirundo rustica rustica]
MKVAVLGMALLLSILLCPQADSRPGRRCAMGMRGSLLCRPDFGSGYGFPPMGSLAKENEDWGNKVDKEHAQEILEEDITGPVSSERQEDRSQNQESRDTAKEDSGQEVFQGQENEKPAARGEGISKLQSTSPALAASMDIKDKAGMSPETVGQQTEAGGKGYKSTATPVTQAAANTPVMKPAARLEPEPESAAKPDSKPKPLAVAPAKKHTVKTNQPVDNDDPRERPSPKSEAKASSTGSEANIDSFSLKDLRGLRKDYRRQPDESIISWLVRLWDAASEATILDSTEARHLGSLSHDPVIDQEMMREASPCSL